MKLVENKKNDNMGPFLYSYCIIQLHQIDDIFVWKENRHSDNGKAVDFDERKGIAWLDATP